MFFYRGGRRTHDALPCWYPTTRSPADCGRWRLVVECTGEGVMFMEADADVRLAELEAAVLTYAPVPVWRLVNCPLLLRKSSYKAARFYED